MWCFWLFEVGLSALPIGDPSAAVFVVVSSHVSVAKPSVPLIQ